MVTKLKNIKYKPYTKAINLVLLLLCLIVTVSATFYTFMNYDYIRKSTFYETDKFYSLFKSNINDAITYNLDETFKDQYIKNHLDERSYLINERNRITERLESNKNFMYYFRDKEGNVYTNLKDGLTPDYLMDSKDYIYVNGEVIDPVSRVGSYSMYSLTKSSTQYNIEIWAAAFRSVYEDDEFSKGANEFTAFKNDYYGILAAIIVSSILALLLLVTIITTAGKSCDDDEPKLIFFDRILNEIQYFILSCYIALVTVIIVSTTSDNIIYEMEFEKILTTISVYGAFVYTGCIITFLSFIRLIKTGSFVNNFLIYRIIKWGIELIIGVIRGMMFSPSAIGGMGALAILNIFVGLVVFTAEEGPGIIMLLMILALDGFAIKKTYEFLKTLKTLATVTGLVAEGAMNYDFSDEKISKSLLPLTENILRINEGIKNAVEKELKIEKMKANLITNVSHDLKTPLTSIITYTKLLKDKDLSDEEATQYIEIIDAKSEKLKRLIEDIVEVNKASTGNIIVELGQLDLSEVVNQISGEYEDGLSEKNLKLVINSEKKNLEVTADGKLVFRVFENLLDNILKYALGGTRVFIDVDIEGGYGVVTIKNITNHSLDSISEDELADRFVRADESRSSDGFGLGLSIADSLIKSMNGAFEITIDGDLFKTRVKLPLKK